MILVSYTHIYNVGSNDQSSETMWTASILAILGSDMCGYLLRPAVFVGALNLIAGLGSVYGRADA